MTVMKSLKNTKRYISEKKKTVLALEIIPISATTKLS